MENSSTTSLLGGFAPVIDSTTRLLILGSFPGVASLAAGQYYAHPRNQFWPLLAAVLQQPLVDLPYPERLQCLLAHRIGLWDVIDRCQRSGSLDSAIRDARANDLARLQRDCPQLRRVCFNGKAAGKFAADFSASGIEALVLPSSSPANAMSTFAQKLEHWRGIIG